MLLKKKLNPYTKNEKMERIFKDFKDVGTYIDIP